MTYAVDIPRVSGASSVQISVDDQSPEAIHHCDIHVYNSGENSRHNRLSIYLDSVFRFTALSYPALIWVQNFALDDNLCDGTHSFGAH